MSDTTNNSTTERFLGLGVVTVLMTLIGWSSVPLFIKHFSHAIDVWTSNGWRYTFSALLWAPVLVWGAWRKSLPKGLWKAALVPALFNSLGQVCFAKALYMINPGVMTFSLRFQIVFVAVGAAVLFANERRVVKSPGFIVGVCMVMAGTMSLVALGGTSLGDASGWGIATALASGLLFACYGLSVRKFTHGMPALVAFAAISQYTAAVMLGLMLALGKDHGANVMSILSAEQFALLLLSSFIGIALGHVCYYISIARLGVAVSSGIIQLQPFLVSAASYFLFGEVLSVPQWCAGMVAIAGAAVMLVVQHRMKKTPELPDAWRCRSCGYDLRGNATGACPECGTSPSHPEGGVTEEFAELPVDQVAAAAISEREAADQPLR